MPAFTTLTDRKQNQSATNFERYESLSSSSSPVGEESDDGKAGIVGVGEDVLDEQVWLAAVL